jgi:hypothetical protein
MNKNNPSTSSSSSFAGTSNIQDRNLVLKEQQDHVVGMIIDGSMRGGGGGAIPPVDPSLTKALMGAAAFAVIEQVVKRGLQAANLKYPAGLGACILLFTSLCLTDLVAPSLAQTVFEALSPGAAVLAKWFPVFFVPGLALLPLSPSMGGTVDVSTNDSVVLEAIAACLVSCALVVVVGANCLPPFPASLREASDLLCCILSFCLLVRF